MPVYDITVTSLHSAECLSPPPKTGGRERSCEDTMDRELLELSLKHVMEISLRPLEIVSAFGRNMSPLIHSTMLNQKKKKPKKATCFLAHGARFCFPSQHLFPLVALALENHLALTSQKAVFSFAPVRRRFLHDLSARRDTFRNKQTPAQLPPTDGQWTVNDRQS